MRHMDLLSLVAILGGGKTQFVPGILAIKVAHPMHIRQHNS